MLHSHLFSGALLEVPFLNAFEELSNPSSSISLFESTEWGDPDDLKQVDPTELLNSPSRQFKLPPMLLTCAQNDSRVSAHSIRRFANLARMQGNSVHVLEMNGGHGGDGGVISWADDASEILDFLLSIKKERY